MLQIINIIVSSIEFFKRFSTSKDGWKIIELPFMDTKLSPTSVVVWTIRQNCTMRTTKNQEKEDWQTKQIINSFSNLVYFQTTTQELK